MTTPTQAQIEVAAQAIFRQRFGRDWTQWDCKADAEAALTAAAQVNEPHPSDYITDTLKPWEYAHLQQLIAATIERCAQVAEKMAECNYLDIAIAIRKLKDDKPIDPNIVYPDKDLTNVFPEETE